MLLVFEELRSSGTTVVTDQVVAEPSLSSAGGPVLVFWSCSIAYFKKHFLAHFS
jgi:hypothetical protein